MGELDSIEAETNETAAPGSRLQSQWKTRRRRELDGRRTRQTRSPGALTTRTGLCPRGGVFHRQSFGYGRSGPVEAIVKVCNVRALSALPASLDPTEFHASPNSRLTLTRRAYRITSKPAWPARLFNSAAPTRAAINLSSRPFLMRIGGIHKFQEGFCDLLVRPFSGHFEQVGFQPVVSNATSCSRRWSMLRSTLTSSMRRIAPRPDS